MSASGLGERRSGAVRRVWALAVVSLLCLLFAPSALGADRVYWGNAVSDTISFASLDGSGGGGQLATTGASVDDPEGVAIDSAAGRIYWAAAADDTISFANLDGSGGGDLPTTGATVDNPIGVAIDPAARRIYWANLVGSSISFANLDGSGGGDLSTAGAPISQPAGVAIDPGAGRIYWADMNLDGIRFANLDGTGGGGQLSTGAANLDVPFGVTIDPAAGRIYWANTGGSSNPISFANLDGSGGGNLTTSGATVNNPRGSAIDPAAGRIYWANSAGTNPISFANLDGSGGGGQLSTTGATPSGPVFPALLRAPAGAGAPAISGSVEIGSALSCGQGSWAGDLLGSFLYRAPRSFAYQWLRNGAEIDGATQATFTPTEGGEYSCRVTATNQAGSVSQTSAPRTVSPVPPPPPPDPPPTPTPPTLEITDVAPNEQKGIAKLTVEFDPSGSLRVDETNKVKGTEPVEVDGPGTAKLTIAARGKGLKRLARRGQVTVNPRAFFDSADGAIGKRHRFKLQADVTGEICLKCWRP